MCLSDHYYATFVLGTLQEKSTICKTIWSKGSNFVLFPWETVESKIKTGEVGHMHALHSSTDS